MDYIKGMTWGWTGVRGTWNTQEAAHSMQEMLRTNVNWTAIAFGALQDHPQATKINYEQSPTVTDEEIVWAIREAHKLELKVCLKPVVNCANGTWRAHICFFDEEVPGEPSWGDWFTSYEQFILHYARIAEENHVEMFCIGCEMVQADRRETEWRTLINKVRKVYTGPITYNCDKYQEERVQWWDAIDYVSSSGYYPIDKWKERLDALEIFAQRLGKPFFFMEAGCPSRDGSAQLPNDWSHLGDVNLEEQAEYYKVMFQHITNRSWFNGFMLWDWPAKLYTAEAAHHNKDYCIYLKPAEQVVADFYKKM
jgi:hypothetical protein